ncbi:NADPH oxidase activator 1 [Pseudonaja textilis]|uniref:NADPH oxidase activator 1 n=1 Tax=Pseudonaja textilis TaxID=8673 RepID=UPI000EAA7257|nr:NADPH oxidase activator 1 [Pseudonaja textilis]
MAYQQLLRDWNRGILALEKGNLDAALDIFRSIKNPPSKIDFNIGCLYLQQGNLDHALEAFNQALSKDNCLAVGFFQRSYVHFQLGRHEEALNDGKLAMAFLRNNFCINYKQLGLAFVLCASEVLHNMAATHCQLGRWHEARETLEEAARQTPQRQMVVALKQIEEHLFLEPQTVPPGTFFRPPLQAEELKEKDYLGQSKVISSALEEDLNINTSQLNLQGEEKEVDRPILYRMVGQYSYTSDAPEDLNFKEGEVLEILSEVNEEWLEGRCNGKTGIFPKRFAEPECPVATRL